MIKAIIVDDEMHCSQSLATLINRYCPSLEVVSICNSGEEALMSIEKYQPEILFLDIEMPTMNAFEMLEKIPNINFEIIFTTSYDQYALKAFRFSALDYLLKPVDRGELQVAVEKVSKRSKSLLPQQLEVLLQKMQQPVAAMQKIALPTMEGLQLIAIKSIIKCESEDNYTTFFLTGNQKLVVSRTLKEIEELLEENFFLRVHNRHVVNLNEVNKYVKGEGGYLVMSDGSTVDVSRSRKKTLLHKLQLGKE